MGGGKGGGRGVGGAQGTDMFVCASLTGGLRAAVSVALCQFTGAGGHGGEAPGARGGYRAY